MKRRRFVQLLAAGATLVAGLGRGRWPARALAASADRRGARKAICLGLDGMDPQLLGAFMDEGALPHFARLAARGGFRPCGTTVPPQSPVAWSTFITGQDPGGHGIFDFIHRNPGDLLPKLSLAEAHPATRFLELGDWRVPRTGGSVELLRHGRAFWEDLAGAGIDTTIFKMPSNYPPVDCGVRSLSGMGTPDIVGTYGIFSYYTDDPSAERDVGGGRIVPVSLRGGRFRTHVAGPPNTYRKDAPVTRQEFEVVVDRASRAAYFTVGDERFLLQEGEWSDWVPVRFPLVPHLKEITGICRFYLMETGPCLRLYVTPVQIDPANPVMPICTPEGYARELSEELGPFYTQGLPDDTKALDEGVFGDTDYAAQADLVLAERLDQYHYELARFRSLDRGFLFFYFNSLDQNSHMFWRSMDPASPTHRDADVRHAGRIRELYAAMDRVLGEAMELLDDDTVLFAVSDHGFAPFHRAVNLNDWLLENGYLALRSGTAPSDVGYLGGIDWRNTVAYGLGINGLYLNLQGRERHGIVRSGPERDDLLEELVDGLTALTDPATGVRPLKRVYRADQIYEGPRRDEAPDIVLGYRRGYRGSNDSALGRLAGAVFADNLKKWSGDHCMAAEEVPGIVLCSRPLGIDDPHLQDMAPTFLRLFGLEPAAEMRGRDILA
ncbi:MAG: hypothetical protein GY838_19745 [bacterium]|nr:hypothetical protein [bacterium]